MKSITESVLLSQKEAIPLWTLENDTLTITLDASSTGPTSPNCVKIKHGTSSEHILVRDDGRWLLCYQYERETKKNVSLFVNLTNGVMYAAPYFFSFRTSLSFSPNGKLLYIDSGITASSARVITLVDLSDLSSVNVIFQEEIWFDPPQSYSCWFNDKSEFVTQYDYEFLTYNGIVADINSPEADAIKDIVFLKCREKYNLTSVNEVTDSEMWRAGVMIDSVSVPVTRIPNPNKITPPDDQKWKLFGPNGQTYDPAKHLKVYGTLCSVNETTETTADIPMARYMQFVTAAARFSDNNKKK